MGNNWIKTELVKIDSNDIKKYFFEGDFGNEWLTTDEICKKLNDRFPDREYFKIEEGKISIRDRDRILSINATVSLGDNQKV